MPRPDGTGTRPARSGSTRTFPRALLLATALFIVLRIGAAIYESYYPPRTIDLVPWLTATAARAPASAGQPVATLYDFSAAWCAPCKQMQRDVFAKKETAQMIQEHFRPVRIEDTDTSPEARAVRGRYAVEAFPTLIVEIPGKDPLRLDGYPGRQKVQTFLGRAAHQATSKVKDAKP